MLFMQSSYDARLVFASLLIATLAAYVDEFMLLMEDVVEVSDCVTAARRLLTALGTS